MAGFVTKLPNMPINANDSEQTRQIKNYIISLAQLLDYSLYNIGEDNFTQDLLFKLRMIKKQSDELKADSYKRDQQIANVGGVKYVSKAIYSTNDSELGSSVDIPLDIEFVVDATDSDILLSANQMIDVTTAGTVSVSYAVDGEVQDYAPQQTVSVGKHIIPHLLPVTLAAGGHNIEIKMSSANARGTTYAGDVYGALSGQISGISIVTPPNYKFKFGFEGIPDNYSLSIPKLSSTAVIGTIDWGDGTSEVYTSNVITTHTYATGGNYVVKITVALTEVYNTTSNTWFHNNTYLVSVIFPDNIVSITVPDIFKGCSNLRKIALGNSLVILDTENGFQGCTALRSLALPNTLTTMPKYASICMTGLYNITVPASLIHYNVSGGTFSGNSYLTKAVINTDVLADTMFAYCNVLSEIVFNCQPNAITWQCFKYCAALPSVEIPSGVTIIGAQSFMGCTALSSVTIPETVTLIGANAFAGTALTSVTIARNCVVESGAFPSGCVINYY